ncbi:hypothetical protein ACQZWC_004611 [Enterobacter bugandensis]
MSILCRILLFSLAISFGAYANPSFHTVFIKTDNKTLATFAVPSNVKMDISSDQLLKNKDSVQCFVGNARLILSYPTGSVVVMSASEIDISE